MLGADLHDSAPSWSPPFPPSLCGGQIDGRCNPARPEAPGSDGRSGNLRRLSSDSRSTHTFPIPSSLVLSIVCLVLPAWADFETAMDAYNRKDYATALREWQALAEQGEADAQDFLGTLHFKGWGVPQDYTKARQWWEKAAAQGSPSAQSDLG